MSKKTLEKIIELLSSLPSSDISLGKKFLADRDFESLQLLINSAIVRVNKGLAKDVVKDEYLKVDLRELNKLKLEVDTYCIALDINQNDNLDYENFDTYY